MCGHLVRGHIEFVVPPRVFKAVHTRLRSVGAFKWRVNVVYSGTQLKLF